MNTMQCDFCDLEEGHEGTHILYAPAEEFDWLVKMLDEEEE
ncbi:gp189 [Mycobacterium phage Omega]|uniref:Uncharacterized protein n=1 Tax=Mycobacterium phage Omega TaxID=2907835 RepID=Q853X6_BPMOM|nr:gp189 [Mycobacterium phage Omega]AAN12832.1 hypothetical protein PBI_OMEGA_189 [Mycobacterium phage Omega]ASZ74251.1 hypothetical protein SEA_SQUINT_175 [Mycobacterium phage Squint]